MALLFCDGTKLLDIAADERHLSHVPYSNSRCSGAVMHIRPRLTASIAVLSLFAGSAAMAANSQAEAPKGPTACAFSAWANYDKPSITVRAAPSGSSDQASKATQASNNSAITPPAPISNRARRSLTRQASLTSV